MPVTELPKTVALAVPVPICEAAGQAGGLAASCAAEHVALVPVGAATTPDGKVTVASLTVSPELEYPNDRLTDRLGCCPAVTLLGETLKLLTTFASAAAGTAPRTALIATAALASGRHDDKADDKADRRRTPAGVRRAATRPLNGAGVGRR